MTDQARCFNAGTAVGKILTNINAALDTQSESGLKRALYDLKNAGQQASKMIPDGKDIANVIAHRGRMLLKLATDLHEKTKKHAGFFQEQLLHLRAYAHEVENKAMTSCLGYQYPSQKLEKLPSVPKAVKKDAEKERISYQKDLLRRHQAWLKKVSLKRKPS
jgi:hypothetical protein